MGLTSLFKRKSSAATPQAAGDDVERARTRARQRLIGAVVLVGIGIIGFPLLFETHPRPVPIDIPIEIVNKDKAAPLTMPPARDNKASAVVSKADVITETASEAGRELPVPPSEDRASTPARPAVAVVEPRKPEKVDKPEKTAKPDKPAKPEKTEKPATASAATKPATAVVTKPTPSASSSASPSDAARARALLEGKDSDTGSRKPDEVVASNSGRFIVQVGAFAEANAARDARQKVEKLGLKTYTQVVETSAGQRIRVRVGPFASRDEADRAAGKLKSAGLTASLLAL